MAPRVNYLRMHTYRTKSNKVRKIRTPGGRLTVQYTAKKVSPIVCGETKKVLNGIPRARKVIFKHLAQRRRTVSRPYGGCLSAEAVEFKIKRAFFNEEIKQMKNASGLKKSRKNRRRN